MSCDAMQSVLASHPNGQHNFVERETITMTSAATTRNLLHQTQMQMQSPSHQHRHEQCRRPRRTAVSFNARVRCKFILHHADYTEQELGDAFMSARDHENIRADLRDALRDIQNGHAPMQRGLEFRSKDAARQRMAVKHQAWAVVLDEQAEQHEFGENDPEYLARLYAETAERSRREARRRGVMDEREARHAWLETEIATDDSKMPQEGQAQAELLLRSSSSSEDSENASLSSCEEDGETESCAANDSRWSNPSSTRDTSMMKMKMKASSDRPPSSSLRTPMRVVVGKAA
mmetsp:Transcript_8939/g.25704  ORF Transcript_8939/g.25704 Transcript_8939/m.25704 type:complete len:290 (+) Transcript_8939:300-1169(+)